MNVEVGTETATNHRLFGSAVGDAQARHEVGFLWFIEVVLFAAFRHKRGIAVDLIFEAQRAPQTTNVFRHRIIFIANTNVDGQFAAHLPIVMSVERVPALADISERQPFGRICCRRIAQQESGNATAGNVITEPNIATGAVSSTAEQAYPAVIHAELHAVSPAVVSYVVVDLMNVVEVESIATITVADACEAVNIERRQACFTSGELAVAVGQHTEASEADRVQIEIRIGTRIQGIV